MLTELTSNDFKTFLDKNAIVVVDYWAEWCAPCKIMSPVLEEISKEFTNIKFAKLNVDEHPEIAQDFEINAIPTLIVFHKGKELTRLVGFITKAVLKGKLLEVTKDLR